jgi:hypothetical protein
MSRPMQLVACGATSVPFVSIPRTGGVRATDACATHVESRARGLRQEPPMEVFFAKSDFLVKLMPHLIPPRNYFRV